ncbi:MAG: SDR family oxidoreductase [Flavobacteriaceae bacterium]
MKTEKTIVITGCSSGFGFLSLLKFHLEGWNVVGLTREITQHLTQKIPKEVTILQIDITNQQSIKKTISKIVKQHQRIDVLVNNAGIGSIGLFEQHNDDDIRYLFEVNVFGLMNMTKAVLPQMRRQKKGIIINMSSIRGVVGSPHASIYTATKFAIQGFSESLAVELTPFNIDVKTIVPGSYATSFHKNKLKNIMKGSETLNRYSSQLYNHLNNKRNRFRENSEESNPAKVVEMIYACTSSEMNYVNVIGNDALELINLKREKPEREFFQILKKSFLPEPKDDKN